MQVTPVQKSFEAMGIVMKRLDPMEDMSSIRFILLCTAALHVVKV